MRTLPHPPADITDDRLLSALDRALMESTSEELHDELRAILSIMNKRKEGLDESRVKRRFPTGDWQDQIEVHKLLGEHHPADSEGRVVDKDQWEYVGRVLKAQKQVRDALERPSCGNCGHPIDGRVITCLDCKVPLHEHVCAERHFWPMGRPR
jgi:hypothetical protein